MIPPEVYRDPVLLVVDKPSGLPTQPDRDGTPDLYTLLCAHEPYVGLHHRLDRPASGLVLLTLSPEVNATVAEDFRTHAIERHYLAVLAGDALAPGDTATWTQPLDGRPARTDARILGAGSGLLAALLSPHTGRTHQLRRHAALAGLPMLGDRRYGGHAATWLPRLALHAWRMRLQHPLSGALLELHAPLPSALAQAWGLAGGHLPVPDGCAGRGAAQSRREA